MTVDQLIEVMKEVAAILTPVGVIYLAWQQQRTASHVATGIAKLDTNTQVTQAVSSKLDDTTLKVDTLTKTMDGQQEKLVSAVTEAAIAKGRSDLASEQAHDKAITDAVKTEVRRVNGIGSSEVHT